MLLYEIGLLVLRLIDLATKTDCFFSHLVHRLIRTTDLIFQSILGLLEPLLFTFLCDLLLQIGLFVDLLLHVGLYLS